MEWVSSIGAYPFRLANTALTLCGNLCLHALSPLLMPFLKETFRRAISSVASGLPPEEFREAYLKVTSDIREPLIFSEHKWDISPEPNVAKGGIASSASAEREHCR